MDTSRHAPIYMIVCTCMYTSYLLLRELWSIDYTMYMYTDNACTVRKNLSRISFLPPLLSGEHSQQAECALVCVCPCLPLQSDPPVTDLPVARKEGVGRKGREGAGRKGKERVGSKGRKGGREGTGREGKGGKEGGRRKTMKRRNAGFKHLHVHHVL